jgi:DNA-binding XRE family transcriptional regulator
MQANNPLLTSVDDIMDARYGKVGTPEREAFRREAHAYCIGQVIHDARKSEKMTQAELAKRVGTDKAYISKIEKGVVEPGVGMFYRIIEALGLRVEIVKPVY